MRNYFTEESEGQALREDSMGEVFQIKARRCMRCGGILTSRTGLQNGYGPCCLRKLREEELERELAKDQYSLFQNDEEVMS